MTHILAVRRQMVNRNIPIPAFGSMPSRSPLTVRAINGYLQTFACEESNDGHRV